MKVSRHPSVQTRDLPRIYARIAQDNPTAADRVLDAIEAAFELLRMTPFAGPEYDMENDDFKGARMYPVPRSPNYLVFYVPKDEEIRILYVMHGARDIPARVAEDLRS